MPTAAQFQQLIVVELSAADSEAQADLQNRVPALWSLFVLKAAWPDVRYWYTYREAVKLLMGRKRQAIDTLRRSSLSVGNSKNDVIADARTTVNARTDSREIGAASTVRSRNHTLNGATTGGTTDAYSDSNVHTHALSYHDIGSGSGSTSTIAHKHFTITRDRYSLDDAYNKGTTYLNENRHSNVHSRYDGGADTTLHRVTYNDLDARFGVVGGRDTLQTIDDSGYISAHTDTTGVVARSHIGGVKIVESAESSNDSSLTASRSFNADVTESNTDSVTGTITGSHVSTDDVSETGSGSASMTHTGKHETDGLTLSRTESHDTTVGASQSFETSQATMLMLKMQQQFKNLQALFELACERISELEQQAVISGRYTYAEMTARDSDLVILCPQPIAAL